MGLIFTIIQIIALLILWTIKFIPITSIGFPLVLLAILGLRKLLDYVFTPRELSILDDLLPGQKNVVPKTGEKEQYETINMKDGLINKSFQMEEEVSNEVFIIILLTIYSYSYYIQQLLLCFNIIAFRTKNKELH